MITTAYRGIYLTVYSSGIHKVPRIKYKQLTTPTHLFIFYGNNMRRFYLPRPEQLNPSIHRTKIKTKFSTHSRFFSVQQKCAAKL